MKNHQEFPQEPIIFLFPPRYSRSDDLLWVAVLYALAKVAEALDARILAASRLVSGHTLKHLIAALAVYWALWMLVKRAVINRPGATVSGVGSTAGVHLPLADNKQSEYPSQDT